jgi:hypothetical protein
MNRTINTTQGPLATADGARPKLSVASQLRIDVASAPNRDARRKVQRDALRSGRLREAMASLVTR